MTCAFITDLVLQGTPRPTLVPVVPVCMCLNISHGYVQYNSGITSKLCNTILTLEVRQPEQNCRRAWTLQANSTILVG
jgi:hypothetical protein